ncbi:hypothetical protein BB560_003740 [Smittium megazygosporum]|uniref:Phosphotransferase n=1 Tax=Smittium megazygosporum TaxID=133381 RepID=A0A2T9ZB66_9FUNG|nr:hypothetical protein BB560_003740 [Smittium megazygosporum]
MAENSNQQPLLEFLSELETSFALSVPVCLNFVPSFLMEMQNGLVQHLSNEHLQMLASHVTTRPTGSEQGKCLSMDLGGTNFRICLYDFDQSKYPTSGYFILKRQKYLISNSVKTNGLLIDWMAYCTLQFLNDYYVDLQDLETETSSSSAPSNSNSDSKETFRCGLTFSFPIKQSSISSGILQSWTKGFQGPEIVGKDIVSLFQQKLDEKGANIKIVAITNDTVSLLVASGYFNQSSQMSIIIGTGNNGCYWESLHNVKKLGHEAPESTKGKEMVINIEWGAFDNSNAIIPLSKFDKSLHDSSPTPGFQKLEKMISGLYIGEIVRIILEDLVSSGLIFSESSLISPTVFSPYALDTEVVSKILSFPFTENKRFPLAESNSVEDFTRLGSLETLREIIKSNIYSDPSDLELYVIYRVCSVVTFRAMILCSLAASSVLLKRPDVLSLDHSPVPRIIGIEGSVYNNIPGFSSVLSFVVNNVVKAHIIAQKNQNKITSNNQTIITPFNVFETFELDNLLTDPTSASEKSKQLVNFNFVDGGCILGTAILALIA